MRNHTRILLNGTALAAVLVGLAAGQLLLERPARGQGMAGYDVMVPKFEVDPFWPKPLPNHWVLGQVIGASVDSHDNVWIIHRPASLEQKESYKTRNEADCCTAAPDVVGIRSERQPDPLLQASPRAMTGRPQTTASPSTRTATCGWAAMAPRQPGPPAGSAAQFAPATPGAPIEGGGERGTYHDSFILKFSPDGKFLGEIGHANGSKGSLDTDNVKGVAQIRFLPETNELVAADGYGNKRVSVWDPVTLKFKRMWGAYGKPPSDAAVTALRCEFAAVRQSGALRPAVE